MKRASTKVFNISLSSQTETTALTFDEGTIARDTQFDVRYTYSHNALYGDALLEGGGVSSYPDELLKEYSRIGINGIWIHAVLYKLVEFPWEPSLSDKWQQRIKGLQSLVAESRKNSA